MLLAFEVRACGFRPPHFYTRLMSCPKVDALSMNERGGDFQEGRIVLAATNYTPSIANLMEHFFSSLESSIPTMSLNVATLSDESLIAFKLAASLLLFGGEEGER